MSKKNAKFTVTVKDWGDNEINCLAVICAIYSKLSPAEMQRIHTLITDKYHANLSIDLRASP